MITIQTDAHGAYPDASADRLTALVERLGEDVAFVIVERDDLAGFAQAIGRPGAFTVEYQEPSGKQWQGKVTTTDEVAGVLLGWVEDRPTWREAVAWKALGMLG